MTPTSPGELVELLAGCSAERRTVMPVGGGTHSGEGLPRAADVELCTAGLARLIAHEPADLTVTVEAGMSVAELDAILSGAGQCWPQGEVLPRRTVGGVLAAAASGRCRLRNGPVRDGLLQVAIVTGDGRLVRAGGRTVKGVAGYDLCRLAVGSLGALGVIAEVTLKLWPRPPHSSWSVLAAPLAERLAAARRVVETVHRPAAMLLSPGRLHVRLDGLEADCGTPAGLEPTVEPPRPDGPGRLRVGVPPARLGELAAALEELGLPHEAQLGVGLADVVVERPEQLADVRARACALGGHAVVTAGDDALRADPWGPLPPGAGLVRRIKAVFDPAGVMAPGRLAGAA